MQIPLLLLLAAGPVGAIDVLYFHIWKFRLYARPQSAREHAAHLMRGVLAPTIFAILLVGRPEGACFWLVAALFAADTINSLVDTLLEPASRAPIGVPPAELALHFIGASVMGAAWAAFMIAGWDARNAPALLRVQAALPQPVAVAAWAGVAAAVALFALEAALFLRARSRAGTRLPSNELAADHLARS